MQLEVQHEMQHDMQHEMQMMVLRYNMVLLKKSISRVI